MTTPQGKPAVKEWLIEPISPEVAAALGRLRAADDVQHIAIMPDVRLAADVCNGTVLATSRLIYPNAVGGDIGCGMAAAAFDCGANLLRDRTAAGRLMAGLYQEIPAIRRHDRVLLPPELEDTCLSDPRLEKLKQRDGRVQLGTLGRGNHFVEFQADEEDRLWVMVHSGSRAMGQAIRDLHLAGGSPSASGLKWLDADSPAGQAYLSDATWAVAYADAGRRAMVESAGRLMESMYGVSMVDGSMITTSHNHVRREQHFGRWLWVHRKGAMPAGEGEPGVIPGSMGTESYHVEGRGCCDALRSSSHGAGRAMSRHDACRRISVREFCRQMDGVWFDVRHARHLRDEAPGRTGTFKRSCGPRRTWFASPGVCDRCCRTRARE
jgi:tRNA-splicing ligase RtcB (3'-phosphate/5'-hydroxy nucleic acid ligase)